MGLGEPSPTARLAGLPVVLIEVQSYVYAAYRARAELARHFAPRRRLPPANCDFKAHAMRERVIHEFWLGDEAGLPVLARESRTRPTCRRGPASYQGHALWAGLLDGQHAAVVARRLMSDDMFSGFGLRTLATGMGRYDPVSYHNGSVWPHDTAIALAARPGPQRIPQGRPPRLAGGAGGGVVRRGWPPLPELFSGLVVA